MSKLNVISSVDISSDTSKLVLCGPQDDRPYYFVGVALHKQGKIIDIIYAERGSSLAEAELTYHMRAAVPSVSARRIVHAANELRDIVSVTGQYTI